MSLPQLTRKLPLILSLALLGAACASTASAQDVRTDYDKKATFERYHTYSWGKVQTTNPLWRERIQDAVDKVLQAKGWQRVQDGGDVTVVAVGSSKDEQEYRTFYNGMGGWRWRGFGETTTTVDTYRVGTLVIDLYDTSNKQLIFRGTATDTLSKNPEKNEKTLDKAVDKMFKKFPPDRENNR